MIKLLRIKSNTCQQKKDKVRVEVNDAIRSSYNQMTFIDNKLSYIACASV